MAMFVKKLKFFRHFIPTRVIRSTYCLQATDVIVTENIGNVRTIGINRPEKRNCINYATGNALFQAMKDFENDDEVHVAILYGVGGNFCSGYDLEEISEGIDISKFNERGPMGPTRHQIKKPVIAAIEGYAVAGGLELALWCDIRIADQTAVMGVFNRRFGVPLIDGGTVRLPAIVGLGRALDLIMTGRPIKVQEAHDIGLVNKVCSIGSAIGTAMSYATSLLKFPQETLQADIVSTRNSIYCSSIQDGLEFEFKNGIEPLLNESSAGSNKFISGVGRHGSFQNLTENFNVPVDKYESKS